MFYWKHCLACLTTVTALVAAPCVRAAAPPPSVFSVRDFGAVGDGRRLDTAALNRAVTACAQAGGGTVSVPPGRYLTGTVVLQSHVTLDVEGGAVLVASQDPKDYPLEADAWEPGKQILSPLLDAHNAQNITVTGRGTLDGQGAVWWHRLDLAQPRKGAQGAQTPAEQSEAGKVAHGRPHLIRFVGCRDVLIEKVSLQNSPEWNIHPLFCENVRVDGVTITAPPSSHNTDGINPESCRNVQITNCRIDNGDDCITLKSGLNELGRRQARPDEDITISNCVMLHGHGGVTIGSEMSGGVRNVAVTNCVFQGTENGIRIKSQRGRGGIVEGVTASNIVMQDVPSPFTITTFYMGHDLPTDVFPINEGTPRFRGFLFSNITARGAKSAGSITGLREMPVSDITLTNVHIQAASGFTCTNAQGITFDDVVIDPGTGPAMTLNHSADVDTARLRSRSVRPGQPLVVTDASPLAARPK